MAQGDVLARIVDEKLGFQLAALEAQRQALAAQLANAQSGIEARARNCWSRA